MPYGNPAIPVGKNYQTPKSQFSPGGSAVYAQPPAAASGVNAWQPDYGRNPAGAVYEANTARTRGDNAAAGYGNAGVREENAFRGIGDKDFNSAGQYQNQGTAAYQDLGQDRGATMSALDRLHQFYSQGPGPSAAEAQMQQGADANMGQAIALAHSGRGNGGNAMAMRQAQFGNAAAGQQLNQQLGVLRANEASNWRQQQLGAMGAEQQGLAGLRQSDINNMGTNQQTGLGYQNAGQQGYAAGAQTGLSYDQLANGSRQAGEGLRADILGRQLSADTSKYGADKGVEIGQRDADAKDTASWVQGAGVVGGTIIGGVFGGPAGAVGGGAAGGAIASSDVRGKKNIQPVSMADVFQSPPGQPPVTDLRAAQGYQYNYKDPNAPGAAPGKQVGPMAQNLPASVVGTGPDGKKSVDTSRLSLVNTAAISETQRKVDQLEALLNNRARYAPGEQLPGPTQPASNIGFHQSGATGIDAMQAGPYGLPTQEEADAAARKRILMGAR